MILNLPRTFIYCPENLLSTVPGVEAFSLTDSDICHTK